MKKAKELVGQKFGKWEVLSLVEDVRPSRVLCVCECGTKRDVRANQLVAGATKSCGCLSGVIPYEKFKHGSAGNGKRTKAYNAWMSMRQRCHNPSSQSFAEYGGRGISVCERWNDFSTFLSDMGEPEDGLSIDRIDVNGNYEPENCRWATYKEQNANRRPFTINHASGEHNPRSKLSWDDVREIRRLKGELSPRELAEKFGVSRDNIYNIHRGNTWVEQPPS